MEDFMKRVVEEKKELDERKDALGDFLNTPICNSLDGKEQKRLNCQWCAMEIYSNILNDRIEAYLWKTTGQPKL